jgi:hypothetical protein
LLDGFLMLLFGLVSSVGVVSCLNLWECNELGSTTGRFLFADGFFFLTIGATGYCYCLVRFVNYLREGIDGKK